jgi:hypothetical protein
VSHRHPWRERPASGAELRQQRREVRIAAGRRRPCHVLNVDALRGEVLGKALEPY